MPPLSGSRVAVTGSFDDDAARETMTESKSDITDIDNLDAQLG
jgi:hypothetical protein